MSRLSVVLLIVIVASVVGDDSIYVEPERQKSLIQMSTKCINAYDESHTTLLYLQQLLSSHLNYSEREGLKDTLQPIYDDYGDYVTRVRNRNYALIGADIVPENPFVPCQNAIDSLKLWKKALEYEYRRRTK